MNPVSINICCNIDDGYAQHCGVMLTSLFEHSKGTSFHVHLLISLLNDLNRTYLNEIIEKNNSVCHFHTVNSEKLKDFKFSAGRRKLSEATYYRLFIASLLDESVKKVLYLDSDMIIQRYISPLFSINLKGYALAATKDIIKMSDEYRMELSLPHGASYFNAGLMLLNLDYWRDTAAEQDLVEFAKKNRNMINHDQDSLNAVFQGKWFNLSPKWSRFFPYNYQNSFFENKLDKSEFLCKPVVIHFFDMFKPWNRIIWFGRSWKKYKRQYYNYLRLTPWKNFKPERFLLEDYQKFGLYKYLAIYQFNFFFINLGSQSKNFYLSINKVFFLPFVFVLKLYYQLLKLKQKNT